MPLHHSPASTLNGTLRFHAVPALDDNYIWIIEHPSTARAIVVDPGEATPVLDWLATQAVTLTLTAILITHHHHDHTDGVAALLTRFPSLSVYGPHGITMVTDAVEEGSSLNLLDHSIQVMATPAHTLDHVSYLILSAQGESTAIASLSPPPALLTGDALFMAGCGRLFEGTAAQLIANMQRFAALPATTQVYAGHEYSLANLNFAQCVEPDNAHINAAMARARQQRQQGQPTLPSTIGQECLINPFIRFEHSSVQVAVQRYAEKEYCMTPAERMAVLRRWKEAR